MKYSIYLLLTLSLSTSVLAGQVVVPNTFTAGTPAMATEVNNNFSTIANGVNANDTSIIANTASVTSSVININANTAAIAGNTININTNAAAIAGSTVDVSANTAAITGNATNISTNTINVGINTSDVAANTDAIAAMVIPKTLRVISRTNEDIGTLLARSNNAISVVSDKGYVYTNINMETGATTSGPSIMFSNYDCTGDVYVKNFGNGAVFQNNNRMYYVNKNASIQTNLYLRSARSHSASCGAFGNVQIIPKARVVSVNDPAVTGIASQNGRAPFIIEYK